MIEVRNRLALLETAHAEIVRLKTALAESEAARHVLEAQLAASNVTPANLAPQPSTSRSSPALDLTTPTAPPTPPKATAANSLPPGNKPSFASVVASTKGEKRKKRPAASPPSLHKATATVSRLFGPQTDTPSGYQFVYMSIARRRPLQEIRRILQGIKVNNSRVLDIQYPVPHVVSFLVHHDYVFTFTSTMHLKGLAVLDKFDPVDPQHVADPKYHALSTTEREDIAFELHIKRCTQSLRYLASRRPRLFASVAAFFQTEGYVTSEDIEALAPEEGLFGFRRPRDADAAMDDDTEVEIL
ncbi:hypothetical protein BD408DRAFT_356694 [Parasitella parasitica]|nr:hypothetical protein BD408DRAFT_356694 [Parasitella parasitica]